MLSDVADLVLGRCCLACGSIGTELCATCLEVLRGAVLVRHDPPPLTVIAGPYDGFLGTAVLAYKQDGHRALARPLAVLLADALAGLAGLLGTRRLTLVRVPGHRRPARGFDALDALVRGAEGSLAGRGLQVVSLDVLRITRDYSAIKALGRDERRRLVQGAMAARPMNAVVTQPVVIVDDVITTGATCAEAVRALTAAGVPVAGLAAIAATQPG